MGCINGPWSNEPAQFTPTTICPVDECQENKIEIDYNLNLFITIVCYGKVEKVWIWFNIQCRSSAEVRVTLTFYDSVKVFKCPLLFPSLAGVFYFLSSLTHGLKITRERWWSLIESVCFKSRSKLSSNGMGPSAAGAMFENEEICGISPVCHSRLCNRLDVDHVVPFVSQASPCALHWLAPT